MAEPFLGELKMISWDWTPKGWAFCNGQVMPINQNQALFSLLGTTYGGDGRTTFGLPDLRGKVPIHFGAGWSMGNIGGESAHTLSSAEMPAHNHFVVADTADGSATPPANPRLAASVGQPLYGPAANLVTMAANSISNTGGSQAHLNDQPYTVVNFIIALQGIFPSQN
jgi:microcystin-dependent protein